jgi:membrane-bound metal-dependent hydrolase YbcI (DUF457 family)
MLIALDARRSLGRGAVAACVIGSLAPDVDAVLAPFGWDRYLLRHQAGTHSVIGSVVCAAALAGALRPAIRGSRYVPLLVAGAAGCLGHLLLDLGSGAELRLFWPVIQHRATFPLFAMADPWLLGFFVLSFLAISSGGHQRHWRAAVLMTILAAFASVKDALYAHACALEARAVPPAAFRRGESVWGSLVRWSIYETRADAVEAWRVDAASGDVRLMKRVPRNLQDAFVERSRAFETVQNFLAAHDVTFAVVSAPGTGGAATRTVVAWSDLRYCDSAVNAIAPLGAPVDASVRPSWGVHRGAFWGPTPGLGHASGVACVLWSGGEFDPAGRPAAAIVDIGRLEQRRPVAR